MEKQIGGLMKCLISSAAVSLASQVDPVSAHLQMAYTELRAPTMYFLSEQRPKAEPRTL